MIMCRDPVGKYHVQVCTTTPCQLCGSDKIVEALRNRLGIEVGHTSEDGLFTLSEVECAGACVNAPVMAVNDDYYEDLTPESCVDVIEAFVKDGGKGVKPGPQRKDRKNCEPVGGLTSLKGEIPGPGFRVREDL